MSVWNIFYINLHQSTDSEFVYSVKGWIIRNITDPINSYAYARGWTDFKPINELTIDDLLYGF